MKHNANNLEKMPAHARLAEYIPEWQELFQQLSYNSILEPTTTTVTELYRIIKKSKHLAKQIINTIRCTRQEEWRNAKNHYIRIGKYGNITRMINPKALTGPTASNVFPTIKGVPGRKTISDEERQEASILTHSMWMANPPGVKNCHFLTTIEDDVGPNGILIDPNKPFETESQYQYLDAQLESIEDHEIIERIHIAHRRFTRTLQTD